MSKKQDARRAARATNINAKSFLRDIHSTSVLKNRSNTLIKIKRQPGRYCQCATWQSVIEVIEYVKNEEEEQSRLVSIKSIFGRDISSTLSMLSHLCTYIYREPRQDEPTRDISCIRPFVFIALVQSQHALVARILQDILVPRHTHTTSSTALLACYWSLSRRTGSQILAT